MSQTHPELRSSVGASAVTGSPGVLIHLVGVTTVEAGLEPNPCLFQPPKPLSSLPITHAANAAAGEARRYCKPQLCLYSITHLSGALLGARLCSEDALMDKIGVGPPFCVQVPAGQADNR